ncbi:MAG: FAD-dependent thymidylate synthase [Brevinematia bacterium]
MKVKLLSITENCEKHIEYCARICYDSTERITEDSRITFIANLIKNGHLSVLEHAGASFLIEEISRACSHQLVRQRLATFSQRSQRYINESNFSYVIPEDIEKNSEAKKIFQNVISEITKGYKKLIELGIKKEDARFLLPNAAHTTLTMTANFREWLHIIDLRVSRHAQWEIRDLLIEIWKLLYKNAPHVFSDVYFLNWSKDYDYKKEIFEKEIKKEAL